MSNAEHVTARYRERVAPMARNPLSEVAEAMKRPLFAIPHRSGILYGLINRRGFRFVAFCRQTPDGPRVETVGAWWHWHETRPEWRRLGYPKRRMR